MTRAPRRVLATILFTDIVRSTEVAAEMGDRRWRSVLSEHHRRVRAALRRHQGREIDNAGDGFFASFGQPTDAIRCAAEIVSAMRDLGIEVRSGIHTGECEIIGSKVGGIAVHIASRVLAEAGPSQVVLTSTVVDLAVGSEVAFEEIGPRSLKGVPGEWRLSRLVIESALAEAPEEVVAAEPSGRRLGLRVVGALIAAAVGLTLMVAIGLLASRPSGEPAASPGPDTAIALDDAGQAALVVAVAAGPDEIAFDGSAIWVGSIDAGLVDTFAPASPGDVETIGQLGRPTAMATGDGHVWVADRFARQARSVEPNGVARFTVSDVVVTELAIGLGSAWATDDQQDRLRRMNLQTGRTEAEVRLPAGSAPEGVAIAAGQVWVAVPGAKGLVSVDPATNRAGERVVELPSATTALAASGDNLWTVAPNDDEVHLVDGTRGARLRSVPVCDQPAAVVADDAGAWVACREGRAVWRVLNDGTVERRFPMAAVPSALTLADGRLWVTLRAD